MSMLIGASSIFTVGQRQIDVFCPNPNGPNARGFCLHRNRAWAFVHRDGVLPRFLGGFPGPRGFQVFLNPRTQLIPVAVFRLGQLVFPFGFLVVWNRPSYMERTTLRPNHRFRWVPHLRPQPGAEIVPGPGNPQIFERIDYGGPQVQFWRMGHFCPSHSRRPSMRRFSGTPYVSARDLTHVANLGVRAPAESERVADAFFALSAPSTPQLTD
ncbi:hypothetical protein BD779DRAFT_520236 [Infundibulicybe gibba]|nr:hypothetical protein BD779DRAFT_520236 [Infundibulicybe gibba]